MPKIDSPEAQAVAARVTKQYVEIPERDSLDFPFPTVRINHMEFLPGQTYELEEPLASTIKERVRVWLRQTLRLMQPAKDVESENIMLRNGTSKAGHYTTNFGG